MDSSDIVIALVVVTALAFDFTNGFHDAANAMATSIATRALPPKVAVGHRVTKIETRRASPRRHPARSSSSPPPRPVSRCRRRT
jgi:hypothetical protein